MAPSRFPFRVFSSGARSKAFACSGVSHLCWRLRFVAACHYTINDQPVPPRVKTAELHAAP
jgi:hypothetical protein